MSTVQTAAREPVLGLLRDFAEKPNCDKYAADTKKIDLVLAYLWLRQLTEGLTFELFLEKFAAIADYDDQNRKRPEDALKYRCPRTKKAADELGVSQWSAKECVEILSVYVDMVREAERQAVEVPMTLDEYLAMDASEYKKGNVAVDKPAAKQRGRKSRKSNAAPAAADPETGLAPPNAARPTSAGQRIIYEPPNQDGRQIKGTTQAVHDETVSGEARQYVTFITDDGETFTDVNLMHCTLVDEAIPPVVEAAERQILWIPKADYPRIVSILGMNQPVGNVQVGDMVYPFTVRFNSVRAAADVNIVNGEMGAYVEAQLYDPETNNLIGSTLPPRQNILGEYRFETQQGVFVVDARTKD